MKWVIVGTFMVIALVVFATFASREADARKQEKILAESQVALLRYEKTFKPGTTRKDVENELRTNNTVFFERCCYDDQTTATVVKIADNVPPWYCSEWPVYIVFEFVPSPPFDSLHPLGADLLKNVHLTSNGDGCL